MQKFDYKAQTENGNRINGAIEAESADAAAALLSNMNLRVIEVQSPSAGRPAISVASIAAAPGAGASRSHGAAMRGADFVAFNQQLAALAAAGLPLETGLRHIARDLGRGRLANTVNAIAEELERGTPLPEAFEKRRGAFPRLYGRLLDAGVHGGNLSGILLNLGEHHITVQRLRTMLWRAFSYPAMVIIALLVVLLFLGWKVLPQFGALFARSNIGLPMPTEFLIGVAAAIPWIVGALAALVIVVLVFWMIARSRGNDRQMLDKLLLSTPLVGPVVRRSLIARWCSAARIGVEAGLDLPASFELAGDAAGSPRLRQQGDSLTRRLASGNPLSGGDIPGPLPETVLAAIDLSSGNNNLGATLGSLSELYQKQAEARMNAIPAIYAPVILIFVAIAIGFVIIALFMPLMSILQLYSK